MYKGVTKRVEDNGESSGNFFAESWEVGVKLWAFSTVTGILVMTPCSSWVRRGWRTSSRWRPTCHPPAAQFLQLLSVYGDGRMLSRHDGRHASKEVIKVVQDALFSPIFVVSRRFLARKLLQVKHLKHTPNTNINPWKVKEKDIK